MYYKKSKFKKNKTIFSQLFYFVIIQIPLLVFAAGAYAQNIQHSSSTAETYTPRGPIVLELFTSTGCPACPKADANFIPLSNRPDIIALGCHVTYFDRPQRSDRAARSFCDARQGVYKMALNTRKLFTPMMVIDGQSYLTGTRREDLQRSLTNVARTHTNKAIGLTKRQRYLEIRLPALSLSQNAEVWLVEYADQNAVTEMTKLMNWDGRPYILGSPINENHSYAVIAQDYKTGVLASGKISP